MEWDGFGNMRPLRTREDNSPWLLFLDRFLYSSLGSLTSPNSKSFSLIFDFVRFILNPLKISSTGSVDRHELNINFQIISKRLVYKWFNSFSSNSLFKKKRNIIKNRLDTRFDILVQKRKRKKGFGGKWSKNRSFSKNRSVISKKPSSRLKS